MTTTLGGVLVPGNEGHQGGGLVHELSGVTVLLDHPVHDTPQSQVVGI